LQLIELKILFQFLSNIQCTGIAFSSRSSPLSTSCCHSWHSPSHLADDYCLVTDAHPRRLCSADTRTLLVSRTRTNFSDRVCSAAGPRVWNCLPTDLRQPDLSYSHFRQLLEIFLSSCLACQQLAADPQRFPAGSEL